MRFLKRAASGSATARARRLKPLHRWALRGAAAGALLLACGAGALWFARSGYLAASINAAEHDVAIAGQRIGLAVASVEVEGRERASRAAILSALGAARGTPILDIDPAAAKTRLEALPWVRSASVERQLPDTIRIRIVERQPLALWQRHGQLVLVDREGVVVPTDRLEVFSSLVVLVGDDAPREGAALVDLLTAEPDLARHVAAAVRVGGRRWNLRLDNGMDVALPEENPAGAWHRLAQLARDERLLERNIEAVDLRLPDRLVLRAPEAPKPPPSSKKRQSGKST